MEVRRSLSDLYECRTASINLHSTAVAYFSAIPFPLLLYLWGARGKPGHGAVYHRSQAVVRTANGCGKTRGAIPCSAAATVEAKGGEKGMGEKGCLC